MADAITAFAGSKAFVDIHAVGFAAWILLAWGRGAERINDGVVSLCEPRE